MGLNLFDDNPKPKWQLLKTALLYLIIFFFLIICCHALILDSDAEIQEKIYLVCLTPTFSGLFIITIHFWHKQEEYRKLIKWLRSLHVPGNTESEDLIFKFDFTNLAELLWKLLK